MREHGTAIHGVYWTTAPRRKTTGIMTALSEQYENRMLQLNFHAAFLFLDRLPCWYVLGAFPEAFPRRRHPRRDLSA